MQYAYKILLVVAVIVAITPAFADDIHDPTAPKFQVQVDNVPVVNKEKSDDDSVKLQGIVNKKGGPMAIIGGELYQVNDEVKGFKITLIEQTSVVLTKSGAQRRLYVYE